MRLPIVRVLCALTSVAAATRPATEPVLDPRVRAELDAVVATLTPPVLSTADAKPDSVVLDGYRKQAAADAKVVLLASDRDVLNLAPGRPFDDAGNRAFTAKADQVMRDFKVDPPVVTKALRDQDRRAPLSGARLELLTELELGQINLLVTAVSGPSKR